MLRFLSVTAFLSIMACSSGTDYSGSSSKVNSNKDSSLEATAEDEDYADVPTAVAGAFLICKDDDSLEDGNNVGCAAVDTNEQKHESSDEFSKRVNVIAQSYIEPTTKLTRVEGHEKWSWVGKLGAPATTYRFSFNGSYKGQDVNIVIEPKPVQQIADCKSISGVYAEGICHVLGKENKNCKDVCDGFGVDSRAANYLNSPKTCSKAMSHLNLRADPNNFKTEPRFMIIKKLVDWGCSILVDRKSTGLPFPLEEGFYTSKRDPDPDFDMPGMRQMCTCKLR